MVSRISDRAKLEVIGAGLAFLIGWTLSPQYEKHINYQKNLQQRYEECQFLVEKNIETATGKDRILQPEEIIELVKEVGYTGIFLPGEIAQIVPPASPGNPPYILVGKEPINRNYRVKVEANKGLMYHYLEQKNPVAFGEFKMRFK